ncbi:MAG: serine/threonine-protein phosphatase [Lachnospiraceae bacterium]|nr:serine/threonine-protein phosphatase [Lachnospiraceae bacterium]
MNVRCVSAHFSECGHRRTVNQDAVFVSETGALSVYLLADGMGGHSDGELASQGVVAAVKAWLEKESVPGDASMPELLQGLMLCLKEENSRIFHTYNTGGRICGTTLVLLVVFQKMYAILSVGDSRIYRLIGRHAQQITTDDVWETDLSMTAGLSEEQIRTHPNHGKLLRALGTTESLLLHRQTGPLQGKTVFLLCSDGIYKYCDTGTLSLACKSAKKSEEKLKKALSLLENKAVDNGTRDNYSAILVRTG